MSDVMANYKVEIARMQWQLAQQRAEVARHRFAICEQYGKRKNALGNINSALVDIAANEESLGGLPGGATALDRQKLTTAIAQQRLKVEERRLDVLKIPGVVGHADESHAAALAAVGQYEQALADLQKTHGELTEEEFINMRAGALS